MSWNGAGSFNRIYSWVADKAAGLNISSTRMDADSNDMAANGFGNCLTRDGQGQPTANLPMANFRHTGVGNGAARTDYASLGQVEDGVVNWAVAGGTADAVTATLSPALTTLVDGQLVFVRASAANATATPTFALNGLVPRTITRAGGAVLTAGDIPGALAEIILRYNLANTRWELLNPATLVPSPNTITSAMLQAASVLYSKLQNVANGRFLGNFSGSAAAPSEYALGSGLAVSGATLNNTALPPQGTFKNLSIKVATNTTVVVAADAVVMSDGAGNHRTAAISATCNLGSAGNVNQLDAGTIAIDTWYYIWAISNGTTDGTLASTSSTAPTFCRADTPSRRASARCARSMPARRSMGPGSSAGARSTWWGWRRRRDCRSSSRVRLARIRERPRPGAAKPFRATTVRMHLFPRPRARSTSSPSSQDSRVAQDR